MQIGGGAAQEERGLFRLELELPRNSNSVGVFAERLLRFAILFKDACEHAACVKRCLAIGRGVA